jgi:HD superfamily phosphohydrolase
MNLNAFIASCKCGKVARKGFSFDEDGNEIEIKNGRPNEEVSIVDENGIEYKFQSKSDAAKHFNISNKDITQIIKNGGKMIDKMKIKIKTNDGNILSYKNLSQLAREMNENKMTVSRAFKGKTSGDKVKIGENEFEIV